MCANTTLVTNVNRYQIEMLRCPAIALKPRPGGSRVVSENVVPHCSFRDTVSIVGSRFSRATIGYSPNVDGFVRSDIGSSIPVQLYISRALYPCLRCQPVDFMDPIHMSVACLYVVYVGTDKAHIYRDHHAAWPTYPSSYYLSSLPGVPLRPSCMMP